MYLRSLTKPGFSHIGIMPDHHAKKRFLNLPKYAGGSKAFREFISLNLHYPTPALEGKVEGIVFVEYDIHDDGTVRNPRILKGLGYGCDEEALRVVSLLQYEKVKNRGVRLKVTSKTTIHFRLPKVSISYTIVPVKKKAVQGAKIEKKTSNPVTYSYTVQL